MKDSSGNSPTRSTRKTTLGLLATTAVLTGAALLVGISDNPPGIILLYCAGLTLVLSMAHRWREPKKFLILLAVSAAGFFVLAIVHNFAEVGAERISHLPVLATALVVIHVSAFLLALIVCPMGVLVGLVGSVVTTARGGSGGAVPAS